jgi:hypothetical protein
VRFSSTAKNVGIKDTNDDLRSIISAQPGFKVEKYEKNDYVEVSYETDGNDSSCVVHKERIVKNERRQTWNLFLEHVLNTVKNLLLRHLQVGRWK